MKKTAFSMHRAISIFVMFIMLSGFTGQAQNADKAKKLLDQVSTKIKGYKNVVIDFKYQLSNAKKNLNQESKGNVALEGNKYVLNFMGVTRLCDGKKVYNIVPEDEEITISNYNPNDEEGLTPNRIFTFFKTGYKYSWDIEQPVNGRKIQYVKLVPTDAKSGVKEILIGIDSQTRHIYNLIQTDKDGTKATFTINSFKTNQPLSKNHFTFNESKYSNYYINRLD
jgi:outer membrane lipoprotein-sorting protein